MLQLCYFSCYYEYFSKKYFESNDFSKSNEFQLANIFYRYIKLISAIYGCFNVCIKRWRAKKEFIKKI